MNATPANSPMFGSIHVIMSHDAAKIHVTNGRKTILIIIRKYVRSWLVDQKEIVVFGEKENTR